MSLIDDIQFPHDSNKELDRCVFHKKEVKHFYSGDEHFPDCSTCDGYGRQAEKYKWDCYKPKKSFKQIKLKDLSEIKWE